MRIVVGSAAGGLTLPPLRYVVSWLDAGRSLLSQSYLVSCGKPLSPLGPERRVGIG